jgi:hypothetical protein
VASKIAWQQFTGSDTAVENTRRLRMVLEVQWIRESKGATGGFHKWWYPNSWKVLK